MVQWKTRLLSHKWLVQSESMLLKNWAMLLLVTNIIVNLFQNFLWFAILGIIPIVHNVNQNSDLARAPIHWLHFTLDFHRIVSTKFNARQYYMTRQTSQQVIKLQFLPPWNEVIGHKVLQFQFHVFYHYRWKCFHVLNLRKLLIWSIFGLTHNYLCNSMLLNQLKHVHFNGTDF